MGALPLLRGAQVRFPGDGYVDLPRDKGGAGSIGGHRDNLHIRWGHAMLLELVEQKEVANKSLFNAYTLTPFKSLTVFTSSVTNMPSVPFERSNMKTTFPFTPLVAEMTAESIVPPIPSRSPRIIAAFFSARGSMTFVSTAMPRFLKNPFSSAI